MLKSLLSTGALLLALTACSSGGGASDAPADVTAALNLAGTWDVTFTTGPNSNCPGDVAGATGTGTIEISQTPGTAAVRVEIIELGSDVFNGRVAGGVVEINYAFNDGNGTLVLSLDAGRLVGSDTFFYTASNCTQEDLIEGTRIGGGPTGFTPGELEGSYALTATVDSSSNPSVPVGTQADMAIAFRATGADSYEATFLSGPYALTELTSKVGDLSSCSGSFGGNDVVVTISRAFASAPFAIAIDAAEPGGDVRGSGTLADAAVCAPVSGAWTFTFQNGGTITADVSQLFCALFCEQSDSQRMAGLLDGSTWTGGVTFGAGARDFMGTFSGDSFSGTWEEGSVTGSKVTTANCVSVAPGAWNLVFSSGGVPQLDPSGGSMTQSGCALTFDYVDPDFGLNITLSGDVTGTNWTPAVTGPFAGTLTNVQLSFASNGQSLTGTASFNGTPLTVTGSKQ